MTTALTIIKNADNWVGALFVVFPANHNTPPIKTAIPAISKNQKADTQGRVNTVSNSQTGKIRETRNLNLSM